MCGAEHDRRPLRHPPREVRLRRPTRSSSAAPHPFLFTSQYS
jgi:hypothetical protein